MPNITYSINTNIVDPVNPSVIILTIRNNTVGFEYYGLATFGEANENVNIDPPNGNWHNTTSNRVQGNTESDYLQPGQTLSFNLTIVPIFPMESNPRIDIGVFGYDIAPNDGTTFQLFTSANTTTQTILGKSSIRKSTQQTQLGRARIGLLQNRTIQGKASIFRPTVYYDKPTDVTFQEL